MWKISFHSFDHDINSMTMVLKLDLDIIKMCVHTENEVPSLSSSNVTAWTGTRAHRNTDTQTDMTEIITHPHTLSSTAVAQFYLR